VHASLAATWLVLAVLVISTRGRAATVGFGSGVSALQYARTEAPAIIHYLRLCFWPHPLIFDYGMVLALPSPWVATSALLVAGLAAAAAWAMLRRPAAGFLGVFFFAVLAPSSSFIPVVTETVAEQRMYLALIPVVVLVVAGLDRWLGRAAPAACLLLAAGLAWGTWERNGDYRSAESIWGDTVAKVPGNERAQYNLGCVLQDEPGRLDDAVSDFERALQLAPDYYRAHCNLGIALQSLGRTQEAIAQFEEALRLKPDLVEAQNGLGNALLSAGRIPEAIGHYQRAVLLKPDYVEAHNDLGCALAKVAGREGEAVAQFREALRLEPEFMPAHFNLANALNAMGRPVDAVAEYEAALRLRPDDPAIHFYLAGALLKIPGRTEEAVSQLKEVERLQPENDVPRRILARIGAGGP
jgi:tetratricopeptide (TPR) repeat protein